MRLECIDIGERRVLHAGDGTTVVKNLAHIGAQSAHPFKPVLHRLATRIGVAGKPFLDPGIAPLCVIEAKDIVQRSAIPLVPRRSKPATRNFSSAFSSTFKPRPGYCGTTASPFSNRKGCTPFRMAR